jgi:hypothetical protein
MWHAIGPNAAAARPLIPRQRNRRQGSRHFWLAKIVTIHAIASLSIAHVANCIKALDIRCDSTYDHYQCPSGRIALISIPIGGVMVRTDRAARIAGFVVLGAVVAFLVIIAPLAGEQPGTLPTKPIENESSAKPGKTGNEPVQLDVRFRDGSMLKLTLRDERIELVTPYGKLLIPATDICRIDFGFHIDAAAAKRVEAAIVGLGNTDMKEREAATAELLDLGENAYPALIETTHAKDAELARRAEAIANKLREKLPAERLERPANDVVITADCRFTGRISGDVLKVKSFPFGDQQVKLCDLACLGSKAYLDPELTSGEQPPFGAGRRPGNGGRGVRGGGRGPAGGPGGFQPGGGFPGGGLPPPNPPGP